MRGAGRRDQLVSLMRATVTQDDYGEETQTWAEIGMEWARIVWGVGAERREAAQTQAQQPATFQMLDNSLTRSLAAKDRIVWNGVAWNVAAPGVPITRGELEVTATAAVA